MTKYPDLFAALCAEFRPEEVRQRTQAGRSLSYITARVAMNRLDSVLGPENWTDEYIPGEKSVICRLTITLPDGSTLTKSDAGGFAGMPDPGDDDKSGFSDAFKRAAVKFGVGRFLYRDGLPDFCRPDAAEAAPARPVVAADRPRTEAARRPDPGRNGAAPAEALEAAPRKNGRAERGYHSVSPQDGRQLLAWVRREGQAAGFDLEGAVTRWARAQGHDGRWLKWDPGQARAALSYASALLRDRSAK